MNICIESVIKKENKKRKYKFVRKLINIPDIGLQSTYLTGINILDKLII